MRQFNVGEALSLSVISVYLALCAARDSTYCMAHAAVNRSSNHYKERKRIAYADPSAVGSLVDGNGALLPEAAQHLASFQIPDVYALCIPIYPSSGDSLELLVFMVDDKVTIISTNYNTSIIMYIRDFRLYH
jgi:hypothetical protein